MSDRNQTPSEDYYEQIIKTSRVMLYDFNRRLQIDENKSSCILLVFIGASDAGVKSIHNGQLSSLIEGFIRKKNILFVAEPDNFEKWQIFYRYSNGLKPGFFKMLESWHVAILDTDIPLIKVSSARIADLRCDHENISHIASAIVKRKEYNCLEFEAALRMEDKI